MNEMPREIRIDRSMAAYCENNIRGEMDYVRKDIAENLAKALEEINNWLVCAPIATAEDMAQNFEHMEELSRQALAEWRRKSCEEK